MAVHRSRLFFGYTLLLAATGLAFACGDNTQINPAGADGGTASDAGADARPDANATASETDATVDTGSTSDAGSGHSVDIQILAFNDFHGNIRPPTPSNAVVIAKSDDPAVNDAGSPVPTDAGVLEGGALNTQLFAGGAAYFATHVKALRASNPNTLLVSAGDMTGASPLASSLYDDEPTIRVMNAIGVDLHGIGNHEFDHGPSELLRLQYGGCNAADHTDAGGSCFADPSFPGATFHYLAANVDVGAASSTKTLFPPYEIRTVGGAKIAFIGMTLHGTPAIVSAAGTDGLSFSQEVATANALVPELKNAGVDAIIVLLHQGGFQQGTYDECAGFSGGSVETGDLDIGAIVDALDPAVDAVASAHTHVAYNCTRNGRLLTSAASYGRLLTQINLTIDTDAHHVLTKSAKNVVITRDVTPDPDIQTIVDKYVGLAAPIAERLVGQITADIVKLAGANGEAPLGDVVADALLDFASNGASNNAVVGFTNIGGLRDSLLFKQYYSEGDGNVTFEKAEAVTPFGNKVEIIQCQGSDLIAAVQQNIFVQTSGPKVLQVSNGFSYTWDATHADAKGQNAADPTSFVINGAPLDPNATYEVATTDFVGGGGDGYTAFKACTLQQVLGVDINAFVAYLGKNEPLATPSATRITRLN